MLTYYYAQQRKIEVEIDETLGAVPPRPLMRKAGFALAGRLSRALPAAERLVPLANHVRDGWSFIDTNQFVPSAALGRIRRYGLVKHKNNAQAVLTGCITVEVADVSDLQLIVAKYRLSMVHPFRFATRLYQLRVQPGDEPITIANALAAERGVRSAEPELLEALRLQQKLPKDPQLAQQPQWEAVDAQGAWDHGAFGRDIRVAVVDQGCFLEHPDLGPPFGPLGYFQNGSDENTIFRATSANFPKKSHGTFCAGMIAGRANGIGGRGIAPQAALSVVGLVRDTFSQEVMARALAFATRPSDEVPGSTLRGVDIISCSIDFSLPLRTVLQRALEATRQGRSGLGTLVFWAIPNEPTPIARNGICSSAVVIPVGASKGLEGPDNCAFGPELEFLAPGAVLSTSDTGLYGSHSGTSFATPLAAGVAALMLGINRELRAEQVRALMRACCTPIGAGGRTDTAGHGVVNAAAAVRLADQSLTAPVDALIANP
jgi:subtilisin family serine protease